MRGYAQKKSCNPLNKNQFLNYTSNHKLKNPWSDECLTVLSNNNPPKVAYTQCQDNNQTQFFLTIVPQNSLYILPLINA